MGSGCGIGVWASVRVRDRDRDRDRVGVGARDRRRDHGPRARQGRGSADRALLVSECRLVRSFNEYVNTEDRSCDPSQ